MSKLSAMSATAVTGLRVEVRISRDGGRAGCVSRATPLCFCRVRQHCHAPELYLVGTMVTFLARHGPQHGWAAGRLARQSANALMFAAALGEDEDHRCTTLPTRNQPCTLSPARHLADKDHECAYMLDR